MAKKPTLASVATRVLQAILEDKFLTSTNLEEIKQRKYAFDEGDRLQDDQVRAVTLQTKLDKIEDGLKTALEVIRQLPPWSLDLTGETHKDRLYNLASQIGLRID
jgi:hypothetical protein